MKKIVLLLLVLSVVALVGAPEALALPQYLDAFKQVYTDGSCGTCHVDPAGGGDRNTYGTMFENQPNHATNPVAALNAIGPAPGTSLLATATPTPTATSTIITPSIITPSLTPTLAPKLILTLNNTMDGTSPPLVSNITSAMLLDIAGNNISTATLPNNMTAQFNLSGISPGDYFIEVNGLAGDHLPTRIDSNASDINQSVGLRLRNSVIGDISNPTYRIKVYPSGNPPVVNSSHPVVNYATGLNESIYNFVIVPGNTSRIEVRVLNTSAELSNFTPSSDIHPAGANFSSEPFQIWILGDVKNSTGVFIGNHGHLYNNTDSNCNTCHGNLSTKAPNFSDITPNNGWCFRCHNGKTGPGNGFVDPRAVAAANGTIAGMVTNESSGSAISGATVTANGMMATTDANGNYSISIAAGTYTVTANATGFQANTTTGVVVTTGNVTTQNFALTPTTAPTPTAPTPKLTLTLNNTMDDNPPIVNNITSAVLLDTSGNTVATAALPNNMTAQFNLSGIRPGDYFIEVNGLAGDHLPARIDSNASDINQSAGLRLQHSVIGNISNPTYRIEAFPSGLDSHPVVNYATGLNETIYNFVIVPGNISRIEVRVLNTSAELSNFSTALSTHDGFSVPFQKWILGDFTDSTGAFIGNHGHVYNNTDSNCNGCHGNLSTKASNFSDITPGNSLPGNGWCFRCHNGKTGPDNGFVDPRAVAAANGTIAGMVTNASSGSALSGATVTANGMMATTDANGNYSIGIAAGTYNVTANATGFQANTTTGVVVTTGNVTTQNFALIPAAVVPPLQATFNISGFKINNATGNGIQDWNITVMNATMQKSMLTGADGSYKFTDLVNGSYNVSEEMKPGFTPTGATLQGVTINGSDVTNVNFTNNPISAINRTFVADLTGSEEVPPEVTLARGNATFNLSDDGTVLHFKVTVANITNATLSHIHLAPVGVNGSIVANLFTGPTKTGRFDGVLAEGNITQANLTGPLAGKPLSALLDNMTNGNTYVNVHTTQHPAGEIRGQIRVAPAPNARFSISGFKINNATGSGIQDWNITLRNGTTNALIDSKPTDANGFYQFIVLVNGSYNVSEEMKPGFTPVGEKLQSVAIAGKDATNVNFTNTPAVVVPVPTFNISGFKINNATGSGVQGWNITLTNSMVQMNMLTGADGSYKFMNLANGTYNVTEEMRAGWMNVSPMSQQVTIAGSDMMNINFTNQPPTAATFNISGFKINDTNGNGIWDPGEMGIANWNFSLFNATGALIDRQSTDATGLYQFMDVSPGTYNVTEEMKAGFTSTNATSMPVTVENMDVMNVNFTNQITVTPPSPQATFNISGFKINGTNNSGMGIGNWNIMLLNDTGAQIASTMTDSTGFYKFTGLTNGTYNVTEGMRAGWTNTSTSPMSQMVVINGADMPKVNFTNMLLPPTPVATFNISGFKINDTDGNGVWDPGEMGIPNWNIMLLNDTGVQLANTSTDASGFYQFTNIFPGNYNIAEEMKPGFTSTNATSVPVTVENMDVTNVNFTNMVTAIPPQATFNISGFKVNDTDGNGVWEPGEMGIEGWNIMLLDDKGTQIASTSTDAQGFYQFTNLFPGTYKVTEEMKPGFTPTSATSKEVTIKDMDVKDVNFLNMMVTVTPTPTPPPTETNTISGFKINDLNGNGKQDAGEEGLPDWNIKLTGIVPATAGIHKETTTDDQGFYSFENLPSGKYLVEETLKGDFVPTSPPVIVVDVENGMNSMNNNFMNRPVSSLIPSLPGVSAKHNKDKDNNNKDNNNKDNNNKDNNNKDNNNKDNMD